MGEVDLSSVDAIPEDLADRLPPFWRRVYQALRELKEESGE